eukprot:2403382-Rhodomonas_salina.1
MITLQGTGTGGRSRVQRGLTPRWHSGNTTCLCLAMSSWCNAMRGKGSRAGAEESTECEAAPRSGGSDTRRGAGEALAPSTRF